MTTLGKRTTAEEALQGRTLKGKSAIVTGANSGLGTQTARVLAFAGANVTLACRSIDAGEKIATGLRAALPKGAGTLSVAKLDLGDPASVRAFATAYRTATRCRRSRTHATPRSPNRCGPCRRSGSPARLDP